MLLRADDAMPERLGFDAHRIAPKLYQGSRPPEGTTLAERGFDMVVLTAEEHQPPSYRFPGVEVVHMGYDDSLRPDPMDIAKAKAAARKVANALASGKRVLVTCYMGHNRSGFVSALALYYVSEGKMSGAEAAYLVRTMRPGALRNTTFLGMVESLQAAARRAPPRRWR